MSGQRRELGGISWIFKQNSVVSIETDRSRVFVFVEYILSEIYFANMVMMQNFRKHVSGHMRSSKINRVDS